MWHTAQQVSRWGLPVFVNDPQIDELDAVGTGDGVMVGRRTQVGQAWRWEPSGDAEALVRLLGNSLVAVGGKVFQPAGDGSLQPLDTSRAAVVVVPPAGEPVLIEPALFTQQWAQVRADVGVPASHPVVSASALGLQEGQPAGGPDAAAPAVEGDRAVAHAVADVSPAAPPAKRPPGRPKKVAPK